MELEAVPSLFQLPDRIDYPEEHQLVARQRRSALRRPTLVLNRSWQPVNVTSVARALTLVWNQGAKVVDPNNYQLFDWAEWARFPCTGDAPYVTTPSHRIRVPEVITLTEYNRFPDQTVTFSRHNVFKRDAMSCQYCGERPSPDELTIDHVVPRAQGGVSSWTNCVLACLRCNSHKADRTPKQAGMNLRKVPVRPRWKPVYAKRRDEIESWSKFTHTR